MPGTPFSRYRNAPILEVDGTLAVGQRPVRMPVVTEGSAEHVVVGGETLDLLASRYYGREELWSRIADANALPLVFDLTPGDRLVIPPLRVATATGRKA